MRHLDNILNKLGLSEDKGIVYLDQDVRGSNIAEIFSSEIRNKLKIIQPDAVYHFNNTPFILFFDKSDDTLQSKTDKEIFKEVWSWDKVPVVFIIYETDIKVFNAFHYQKEYDSLREIELDETEIYQRFSFWELQSGNTWKWIEDNFYKKGNKDIISPQRVNQKLFDNIKFAREHLLKKFNETLNTEFINILILRLIFIRYLIDRDVKIDKYINGANSNEQCNCFNQLISDKDSLIAFFGYLQERFNGNLFENQNDPDIPQACLDFLSLFFAADLEGRQPYLFLDVFDFSIIPVEIISGIYESVIDDEKRKLNSAVYTPLFLVDYILDNTIDKHLDDNNDCKVLDPSCGSGIFLTQTYRRLVEHEKLSNETISDERLKEIAEQNIFGIDRDWNALNVAAFSIYISILDYKEPCEINNFRLPDLIGNNLFRNDFFNEDDKDFDGLPFHPFNKKLKDIEFDFILGNPPWGSKKDKLHKNYIKKNKLPVAKYEIAQSFLIRSKDFVAKKTKCALVVTSKAFYNIWAKKFKGYFFSNFYVNSIFDLSATRRLIFESAINPAMIVFYQFAFGNDTKDNIVSYTSIKPNRFLKDFGLIVIEKNDIKKIQQKYFIEYAWLFKVALYGSILDFNFLKRLHIEKNTLLEYIELNKFSKGDGILKKNNPTEKEKPFTEILNKPKIENKAITDFFSTINKFNLVTTDELFLKSGKRIDYYKGKQILLKARTRNESDIVISFIDNEDIHVFKHCTFGISTKDKSNELKQLYGILIAKIYTYYQFLTAPNWGVYLPEIALEEYLSFPYADIPNKDKFIALVEQFINHYKNYYTSYFRSPEPPKAEDLPEFKEINRIVNETYQVSPIEEDLIDYVLNVSRYQFQESKLNKFLRPPTKQELRDYAQVSYNYFGNIYNEDEEYFQIEVYPLKHFTAMKFIIVPEKPTDDNQIIFPEKPTEEKLFTILSENLSIYQLSSAIFIQKDVKGFEKDWFYIIKPNEYKSWHKAIAHLDLAEFDNAILKAEYNQKDRY